MRNCRLLAPEPLGVRDLLIGDQRIAAIADVGTIQIDGVAVQEIDVDGRWVLPGLVDCHVHVLGGGGEGGPATRAPEIRIEEIVANGVTTVIGCLGTDGITRHMSSLVAKARGLEVEGISTYVYDGSYELPAHNLTGSVRSDLVLIDKVIGAGEIAISDHRSAQPTFDELARLAAECRVGGMLGGKAGVLHLHLGDGPRALDLVFRLVQETEIPPSQIVPTHCNRNRRLFDQAMEYALAGGSIDLTAGLAEHGPSLAIDECIRLASRKGVPLEHLTVSSDANGSLPHFDEHGRLLRMEVGTQATLLASLRNLVTSKTLELDQACRPFTLNPATVYRLDRKGRIAVGADADLLVLDQDLEITEVFARGRPAVVSGEVTLRGTFSPSPKGAGP